MTDFIHVNRYCVDFWSRKSDGACGISVRGVSRMSGVFESTILGCLASIDKGWTVEFGWNSLERFEGESWNLFNDEQTKAVKSQVACAIIAHYALDGLEKARDSILLISEVGLDSYIQGITGWLVDDYQSTKASRTRIDRLFASLSNFGCQP